MGLLPLLFATVFSYGQGASAAQRARQHLARTEAKSRLCRKGHLMKDAESCESGWWGSSGHCGVHLPWPDTVSRLLRLANNPLCALPGVGRWCKIRPPGTHPRPPESESVFVTNTTSSSDAVSGSRQLTSIWGPPWFGSQPVGSHNPQLLQACSQDPPPPYTRVMRLPGRPGLKSWKRPFDFLPTCPTVQKAAPHPVGHQHFSTGWDEEYKSALHHHAHHVEEKGPLHRHPPTLNRIIATHMSALWRET